MARPPRLSACIVARNEAAFITACVQSAWPAVDEVVVVDTGSTDDTPGLAARAGARVIRAAWPGDLGRAHDLPLAHAAGDWVLSLDADEVLDPRSALAVRRHAASARYEGYRVPIRNYGYNPTPKWRPADPRDPLARGALGYMPSAPVRLFRHRRGYHHRGLLHQSVAPSIREAGGRIGTAAAVIHHYGYLGVSRAKSDLYVALARRQAALTPRAAQAWIDLGLPFLQRQGYAAAAAAFRVAHGLGAGASASYWLGETLLELDRPAEALAHLLGAVTRGSADRAPEFDRADVWLGIARAHEMLGHGRRAIAAYRRALALRPDHPVALNDLAALLGERGDVRRAEALVEEVLARWPGLDMAWATLGTLRIRRGALAEARRALQTALDIEPRSRPARANLAVCRALAAGRQPPAVAHGDGRALRRRIRLQPLGRGGVVSLVYHLGGGAGRVVVDVVRALQGRPQLVVCFETDDHLHQGLRAELARAGVRLLAVRSAHSLRTILAGVRPATVIHHWGPNSAADARRAGQARWIALGHSEAPMPLGYDAYVTISDAHAGRQRHLPAGRVHHIPNGIDLNRFTGRARPAGRRVTIAMLTRMDAGKFSRRLLDHLPDLEALGARLLIAGRGRRRYEIEPEVAARGLSRVVRFVGPISSRRVPGFLARADLGLHLTETAEEQCSMAILEMLAAGLPVVAEPKGCLPEMIHHGRNGFLALEPKEIAGHLETLIRDPALRRRMGAASRAHVRRWSMPRFRRRWRALVGSGRQPAPVSPVRPAAPRRFARWRPSLVLLVCSTPRAGGGLLCEALGGTGLAGRPDDVFEPSTARTLIARWGNPPFRRFLEQALEDGSTPNGVFAARLTLEGLTVLRHGLGAPDDDGRAARAVARVLPGLRWVSVVRRDRLRQAISWVRAQQSGLWARVAGEPEPAAPRPRFDRAAIAAGLARIEAQEAAWRRWFEASGVTPIRVAYEDLAVDYEGTPRRVAREAGIALPGRLVLAPRQMAAMADELTEHWVRRFQHGRS